MQDFIVCALLLSLIVIETSHGFTSLFSTNQNRHHQYGSPTKTTTRKTTTTTQSSSPSSKISATAAVNGESAPVTNGSSSEKEIRLNVFEKARTVTSVCTSGTLSTVSRHEGIEGAPFGSFVDYVLDDDGNPVFLMNDMSMHTINIAEALEADQKPPMVTLFTQLSSRRDTATTRSSSSSSSSGKDSQEVSRCSLTGTVEKIDPAIAEDMDTLRMRYSIAHSYADQVMDSPYFNFYRLVPSKIYYVGGFGVSSQWVEAEEYRAANPDILAKEVSDIVSKINREHGDDLMLTGEHLLGLEGIERIRVTNVDRLGMDVRVTCQASATRRSKLITDEFRIGFRIPVISVEDAKSEILKVFQDAWEKGNGYKWSDDEEPGSNIPVLKIAADSLE